MKKNFLLLFLMALLPLAGWGQNLSFKVDGQEVTQLEYEDAQDGVTVIGTTSDRWSINNGRYYGYNNVQSGQTLTNVTWKWSPSSNGTPIEMDDFDGRAGFWYAESTYYTGNNVQISAGSRLISIIIGLLGGSFQPTGVTTTHTETGVLQVLPDPNIPDEPEEEGNVVLKVQPTTSQTMVYQSKTADEIVPNLNWITTSSDFVNLRDDVRQQVAELLIINQAAELADPITGYVGDHDITLGLKDATKNTVQYGEVLYIIQTVDHGSVKITPAKNELNKDANGNFIIKLAKGLTYTGEPQNLVLDPAEGEQWAKFGTVQFFAVFEGEESEEIDWLAPGEIPTGTKAGTYSVYARAAAGANWTEGESTYVGDVVIGKAAPVFSGEITGVQDKYFYAPDLTITPSGVTSTSTEKIRWRIRPQNADGTFGPAVMLNNWTPAVGKWQIYAQVNEAENYLKGNSLPSIAKIIEVVAPKLKITTTPSTSVGYGTALPTFSYGITWEDGKAEEGYADPATVEYVWYEDLACTKLADKDDDGNYPVGAYYVKVEGDFTTAYHAIEYVPATVFVTAGEIVAQIEDNEFVYGQTLPLQLKYKGGAYAPESPAIAEFEKAIWTSGFLATNTETGEEIPLTTSTFTFFGTEFAYNSTLLPVGEYKVTAKLGEPGDPAQIIAGSATWTITPKDINNTEDFAQGLGAIRVAGMNSLVLHKTYTSEAIELTEDDLKDEFTYREDARDPLVLDEDYEITGYSKNIHAGTATFTVKGINNFTGEKDLTFTIDKAKLYVYPKAGTWQAYSAEENFEINWGTDNATQTKDPTGIKDQLRDGVKINELGEITDEIFYGPFVNDRNGKLKFTEAKGFRTLAVKRISSGTAGEYPAGIKAYATEEADDYDFVFMTAPLTITKGEIHLAAKDVNATYAGDRFTFDATACGFELAEGTTFLSDNPTDVEKPLIENWQALIIGLNDVVWTLETADKYEVGQYKITATLPEGGLTATNFIVYVDDAEAILNIGKATITLTAKDKGPMSAEEFVAKMADIQKANDNTIIYAPLPGDAKLSDFASGIAISEDYEIEGEGDDQKMVYTLSVIAIENDNYEIETVDGKLTISPDDGIVLYSEADVFETDEYDVKHLVGGDWKKLIDNNGKAVNGVTVYIKQPSIIRNGKETAIEWNADQWYSLCLPFDAKIRDISAAFEYAIVNVVDPERTAENDVFFRLAPITESIPANTPFCLKSDVPFVTNAVDANGYEGYIATFPGIHIISKPAEKQVSYAFENDFGYTFDGTYEALTIDNSLSYLRFLYNEKWAYIGSSSSTVFNMQPYTGYVNLGAGAGARNVNFHFEEADGTVTSIDAVDFMSGKTNVDAEGVYNLNGIKLQGAPTQKGVYIQKGQKVIVK